MKKLIRELLPHAPQLGLYVSPRIPEGKLQGALRGYAKSIAAADVLALYDATLMGSARDGAVFTVDRFVFQNNNLGAIHDVRYEDIVQVETRRKMLGGQKVYITVNRGRATFDLAIDFSGKPDAAQYAARFLQEAMLHGVEVEPEEEVETDVAAVRQALEALRQRGQLSSTDYERLLEQLPKK